jgi:hypothetical protein
MPRPCGRVALSAQRLSGRGRVRCLCALHSPTSLADRQASSHALATPLPGLSAASKLSGLVLSLAVQARGAHPLWPPQPAVHHARGDRVHRRMDCGSCRSRGGRASHRPAVGVTLPSQLSLSSPPSPFPVVGVPCRCPTHWCTISFSRLCCLLALKEVCLHGGLLRSCTAAVRITHTHKTRQQFAATQTIP